MTPAEASQRWRDRHPERSRKVSRQWRKRNKETMAFLNRRNKLGRKLMVDWVKANRPDVYEACHREARRIMPPIDLDIAKERDKCRG